jgi:ElaB/YqjD/DUF883 family membrane-anchored ribosome-binding protein
MDNKTTATSGGGANLNIQVNPELIKQSVSKIESLQQELKTAMERMSTNIEQTTGVVSTSANNIRQKSTEVMQESKTKVIAAVDSYKNYINSVAEAYFKADTGSN